MSHSMRSAGARRVLHPATDAELLEELDYLVREAARGDRRAVGAIAIAFGPMLLEVARRELGPELEQDAGDVLQGVFLAMAEARMGMTGARGTAIAWMRDRVKAAARQQRWAHRPRG